MNIPKFELSPILGPISAPLDFGTISTTQKHAYGRLYETWDGKRYRYGHSVGDCLSGFGAANVGTQNIAVVLPVAAAVGDMTILVTIASGDGYAGNGLIADGELCGANLVIGHGEALVTNRTILANTPVASGGGTSLLQLDGPVTQVMTAASSYSEIVLNRFAHLNRTGAGLEYHGFMGVPEKNCASTYNGWFQTRGPCWLCPGSGDATPGNTVNDRTAFFVGDGSVNFGTALTVETGYQMAGYCIDTTAGAVSALPMIQLMLE
jgi:hypothetical protein